MNLNLNKKPLVKRLENGTRSKITCSCVPSSPAMNCPGPSGNETVATNKATIPGYKKRLKMEQTVNLWPFYFQTLFNLLFLQKFIHFLV